MRETIVNVAVILRPTSFDARSDALLRLLRTVLDEARALLAAAPIDEDTALLEETIARLQREAEALAPDFPNGNLQNGAARG